MLPTPEACILSFAGDGLRLRSVCDDPETARSWAALMAAAQDGDRQAYARLLREILPFVRAVAGRRHGTPDRVEDVVQDVLLTVHRVRQTYDPGLPFEPWLAAI